MSDVDVAVEAVEAFERGLTRCAGELSGALAEASNEHELRAINAKLVGPSGELTLLLKRMPELPAERRREFGQRANQVKQQIQAAFQARLEQLARVEREAELGGVQLDLSLPGRGRAPGGLHPLTRVKHDVLDVLASMGFRVADGPEVDSHENNFDRLAFPPDHPATDMQDTFFVSLAGLSQPSLSQPSLSQPAGTRGGALLRTHTSTVQSREMRAHAPPLAVVSAGATFRRDDDATHSPMFMQVEGFLVDEGVSFAHLKGVLTAFLRRLFDADAPVRFRPSYFPFVEPGGEVDIGCTICRRWRGAQVSGSCRVCKDTGFIEILGCGMIHPLVLEQAGYDSEKYTGFAFGMGIDRVAMLRYGIPHVAMLYGNDARFLSQL